MSDNKKHFALTPTPRQRVSPADRADGGLMADPQLTFAQAAEKDDDVLSARELFVAFRRHRWLVLGVTSATILAAAAYTYTAERVYQSVASIRIDSNDPTSSLLSGALPIPDYSGSKVVTEMEVLRSRQLAEGVARALSLNLSVVDPPGKNSIVRAVKVPEEVPSTEITLTRRDDQSYDVKAVDESRVAVPSVVQVGMPFSIGPAKLVIQPAAPGTLPEKMVLRLRPLRKEVDALRRNLTVSRPNRDAEIVAVSYRSSDPQLAAAVPNGLLDEFIRYKALSNKTEATSTVGFLRSQVTSYDGQLKAAEAALGEYRQQQQVVSIGDEASAQVKRMAELQAERDQVLAERRALAAVLAKPPAEGESSARDIASFPAFITNRGMQDILSSLMTLETERDQLLVRRNPENADVVALTKRIEDLQKQLSQMARGYLSGLDSKLASLQANVQSFGKQLETIPAREIAFARLSRQQKLLEEISTLLQTRLKEAEIKEAVQPGDVRVLDRALVPDRATLPKPVTNLSLGLMAGLLLGLTAAIMRDRMDTKVRTKDEVQSVTGGIPVLGAIPRIQTELPRSSNGNRGVPAGAALASPAAARVNALVSRLSSRDVVAEAYRSLRTNITFAAADYRNEALVITSALPGDGKSTIASSLGVTLAQQDVRTLLIDADLRKGVLHKIFGMRREPGMTQVLIGDLSLAEAVQTIPVGEGGQVLYLLTSGRLPPNPAELLGSDRMRNLLEELRQQFDMIVFDTPPLTMVTDAALLGTLVDSTILVVRSGTTDKRALHHAAEQLYHLRVHVGGTIVNDFQPGKSGYEYGYGYAYGYGYGDVDGDTG